MTLYEYLVPSRHRRELLKVLRAAKEGLTVRQLAQRAGVAYSNAHREVRMLAKTGVLSVKRAGQALVCRWEAGKPAAKALDSLCATSEAQADDDTLYANLRRWRAPLAREGASRKNLSLEETLGHALSLARHHPDVARVWPVVYARNAANVSLPELASVARGMGEKRALGFLLSLTAELLNDRSLARFAGGLRDSRDTRTEEFFLLPRSDRARALEEENTPRHARRWLFRMNMPMESFESLFRKFID
jgi:IclR-like helix-turn-helix domain-containing protein